MEVVVHEFYVYELFDPDVHAAEPLYEWEKSLEGQWVFKNSKKTPSWHRCPHGNSFGWKYIVKADLQDSALTEWILKNPQSCKKVLSDEF